MSQSSTAPMVFLHVPKVGGTTTSDYLDTRFSQDQQFVANSPEHFGETVRTQSINAPLIRGHLFLRDLTGYAASLGGRRRTVFTIVRSPEAQTLSLLWHYVSAVNGTVQGRDHPAIDPTMMAQIDDAAAHYLTVDTGFQTSYFIDVSARLPGPATVTPTERERVANDALSNVDVVGISERLQESFFLLAWRMGWPAPVAIGQARKSGAGKASMSDHVRSVLSRRLDLDSVLYASACRRFETDIEKLAQEAGSYDLIPSFLDRMARV